jgi:hypothetical protein
MKRFLLFSTLVLCAAITHAQFEEDFSPEPVGWTLSNGAQFGTVSNNGVVITPSGGGGNPGVIGTPAVTKTSNTFKVCLDFAAYKPNLNSTTTLNCITYMDVLFVKSTVTTSNGAQDPANIIARLNNYELPTSTGNFCFTFTFPVEVTDPTFKVFLSFHAPCNQDAKYVIDNVNISGVDDVCSGNSCPPSASNDQFTRINPSELSFAGVLYGSNLNYPVQAGYAVDAGGTDNDQNDTHDHLRWEAVTQPVNGSVVVFNDGTFSVTRNNASITQLTFTYRICDDGADNNFALTTDNLCDEATVTINFPAGSSLPASFSNYGASRNGSTVTVKWTTTFESNNKGFEIQRSIGNAGAFQTVGFVATKAANGNSTTPVNYEYKEQNAENALTWYRLVQVDLDGTRKIYSAKAVRGLENNDKILLYPNPSTTGQVNVLFGSSAEREILVSDAGGKIVKRMAGYKSDNLTLSGLQPGMYVLQVTDAVSNKRSIEKIIVTK